MDPTDDKRTQVESKLTKRDEERVELQEKRRTEKAGASDPTETSAFFHTSFHNERKDIEEQLKLIEASPKENWTARFDELSLRQQKLQKYLSDSVRFLPSYDVRQSQEACTKLETAISEERSRLLPKKKFAFKSRNKQSGTGEEGSAVAAAETLNAPAAAAAPLLVVPDVILEGQKSISNLTGETVVLMPEDVTGKDLALMNLKDCTIYVRASPNSLHAKGLHNCRVCIGPASRSLFISDCTDCVLAVACQQLRVHNTKDTDFYLHVTSRAIIEDCDRCRFAPYTWEFDGKSAAFDSAGLDQTVNNWNDVDDFRWIKQNVQSPHWSILPEEERIKDWTEPHRSKHSKAS